MIIPHLTKCSVYLIMKVVFYVAFLQTRKVRGAFFSPGFWVGLWLKMKKSCMAIPAAGLIPTSATSTMPRKGSVADLSPAPVVVNKQIKRTGLFFGTAVPDIERIGKK